MASVSINTGPAYHEDRLADSPRDKWAAILRQRKLYIGTEFEYGCECIVSWLAEAEQFHAELGYSSADEMLEVELEIPPDWVRMAAAVLEATGENLSKAEVDHAIELKAHGRPNKNEERKGSDLTLKTRGESADYIKARLRRDHPEIAEQLEAGEFKSARQAGIAAGFIKPIACVRLVDDLSKVAASISKHLSFERRMQLVELLLNSQKQ